MVNTNLSLWTPLLTDSARRQACIQYSGRCCNCGSSEHSLRWCPVPLRIPSPFSTPSLQRTTRMAQNLRYGKTACADGADAALPAALKVMADDSRLTTVTPKTIAEALLRTNKVIVLDSCTLQASPQPRLTLLHPRVPMVLVSPRRLPPCATALRPRVTLTRMLGTQSVSMIEGAGIRRFRPQGRHRNNPSRG